MIAAALLSPMASALPPYCWSCMSLRSPLSGIVRTLLRASRLLAYAGLSALPLGSLRLSWLRSLPGPGLS